MKYTVRYYQSHWHVDGPDGQVFETYVEARATIFAFALNAVTDGMKLQAVDARPFTPAVIPQPTRVYDGPTDWVAS